MNGYRLVMLVMLVMLFICYYVFYNKIKKYALYDKKLIYYFNYFSIVISVKQQSRRTNNRNGRTATQIRSMYRLWYWTR